MPDRVFTQSEIEEWREDATPKGAPLTVYRHYARSEQGKPITGKQQQALGRRNKYPVADNVLRLILRTAASRLALDGFTVEGDGAEAVQEFLDGVWLRNSGRRLQYGVHFAQLRDGNHAVSLRWKPGDRPELPGRVTIHREPWWDGTAGVFVAYDDFDEPLFAVKEWQEKTGGQLVARRTVYYPDLIQRFRKTGAGWELFPLPGDPEDARGSVEWVKADGTPLGIPIIHFGNNGETDLPYGDSDIAGLIGLQDDLNAMQRDMTAASALTGFPMYATYGSKPADGEELEVAPGMVHEFEDAQARMEVIQPGSMATLTETHAYKRTTMAIVSSTPIHLIAGGEWPSGAALIRAEMPLIDKIKGLQDVDGPSWTTVAHRATEIANRFGGFSLNEDAPIYANWADPSRIDELTRAQIEQAQIDAYATLGTIRDPVLLAKTGLLTEAEIALLIANPELDPAVDPATGELGGELGF